MILPIRLTGLLFSVALLAGCYETDSPVFDKGEKIAIPGKYQCANRVVGNSKVYSFTEKRDGIWPFASYQYIDGDGELNLFRKLPSGLFVGQSNNKRGKFGYVFIDFIDDRTFLILSADLLSKGDYIKPLLKKFGVEFKSRGEFLVLNGDKSKIADFFAAHDKTLLTVVMKCDRLLK